MKRWIFSLHSYGIWLAKTLTVVSQICHLCLVSPNSWADGSEGLRTPWLGVPAGMECVDALEDDAGMFEGVGDGSDFARMPEQPEVSEKPRTIFEPQEHNSGWRKYLKVFKNRSRIRRFDASYVFRDIDLFMTDLLNNEPEALDALEKYRKQGTGIAIEFEVFPIFLTVFGEIGQLTQEQFDRMSSGHLIEILMLYTFWNFTPPEEVLTRIEGALLPRLFEFDWRDLDKFSFMRAVSSFQFSSEFEQEYLKVVESSLEQFLPKNFVGAVISEIFRGTEMSSEQRTRLLEKLKGVLEHPGRLNISKQRLKDGYRGIQFLQQFGLIEEDLKEDLILGLEYHLKKKGVDLSQGGTSGYDTEIPIETREERRRRKRKERRLRAKYKKVTELLEFIVPSVRSKPEYEDVGRPGFFDPVDKFYFDIPLVFELDGRQHYYRPVTVDGEIINTPDTYVLNEKDRRRDEMIRAQGILVLRLTHPMLNGISSAEELKAEIRRQNPGMKIPFD